ncbi:hypothetical protein NSMM_480057 [Nitrosomonas mobilis]|uniref:Uncharacterized protein n=1 Tax=Nitrosomonas mobilis TaxID=51642 RepID=A0A1G5SFS8_9PROT|nr:hypothetical protein NSMM_480057 [Nitrosomonas mobilis]
MIRPLIVSVSAKHFYKHHWCGLWFDPFIFVKRKCCVFGTLWHISGWKKLIVTLCYFTQIKEY